MATEREWQLARELLLLKLELYKTQQMCINLFTEKVQSELVAMGDKWTPPETHLTSQ
jgi:hypothetical protein